MNRESKRATLSRRSFFKALGATAAALPFYRMLENNFVLAQTGELPLKFLGFGFYHGTAGQLYSRRPGETDTDFTFDYAHSPFAPLSAFQDRISVFEGFDFAVGKVGVNGEDNFVPMHGSMGLLMTGSCMGPNASLQNASIDQYLAERYGGETRFRSMQIRGYDHLGFPLNHEWCLSFDSGGNALSPLHDPIELWEMFFATAVVGDDPAAMEAARRKQAIGASVLDFVAKDIQRMQQRLANPEREKLEQHLTHIRGLEKTLGEVKLSAQCTVPPRRDPASNGYVLDKFTDGTILPITRFNLEIMAEAIVCDLTRFATFLLPNEYGPNTQGVTLTLPYDGSTVAAVDGTEDWDRPVFHNMHDQGAHRLVNASSADAVTSQRVCAAINRLYFGQIASVMERLDAAGLLDSTVIMAGSDGGDGAAHSTLQVPMLLAGGANGALKLGKRIVAPGKKARAGDWCSDGPLASHNPILVAIANLFAKEGEQIERYGTGTAEHTRGIPSLLG